MGRVPIVNNAGEAVTFERRTANSDSRGTLVLQPGATHYEPGIHQTFETLMLKYSDGEFTGQSISVDELADNTYEKIEVTRDFKLVKHIRKTSPENSFSYWNLFKSRSTGRPLPR